MLRFRWAITGILLVPFLQSPFWPAEELGGRGEGTVFRAGAGGPFFGPDSTNGQQPEPVADGKPLSYWIAQLKTRPKDQPGYKEMAEIEHGHAVFEPARAALAKIGEPAVPALAGLITNEIGLVRMQAILTLGMIGPAAKDAVPALIEIVASKSVPFRSALGASERAAAIETLAEIGPGAREAIPVLVPLLSDPGWTTGVPHCLLKLGADPKVVLPKLTLLTRERDVRAIEILSEVGPAAADAVDALTEVLKDTSGRYYEARKQSARTLGLIGPAARDALPALVLVLTSVKPYYPNTAQGLLEQGKDELLAALASEAIDKIEKVAGEIKKPSGEDVQPEYASATSSRPAAQAAPKLSAKEDARVQPSTGPIRVGGYVKYPKLIRKVSPDYPPAAVAARAEGSVLLEVTVNEEGRVVDAKVLRSIQLLDQAALDAVRRYVYEPPIHNGKPQAVIMTIVVTFVLPPREP